MSAQRPFRDLPTVQVRALAAYSPWPQVQDASRAELALRAREATVEPAGAP